ncbi:MAG: cobalamin B12-binding domain-containing protein [Candidatus Hydrogenedentes bacterium]|nr:cobalamin B12-binding domain-containing protein [Candidatus Hydrogenedentota bacterium]
MSISDEPKYPMGAVARKTSLSPHVIRVWERRYGAVLPGRTGTNRRLYSDLDIRRLNLLRVATEQGQSIGLIARLKLGELEELVKDDASSNAVVPRHYQTRSPQLTAGDVVVASIECIKVLDRAGLETLLGRAATVLSVHALLETVVGPLMDHVGALWRTGELRPAHEHLASDTVRAFLSARRAAYGANPTAPVIVATTPAGQTHEIGALMVSLLACADGWNDMYLGPNLPAEDIVAAVTSSGARVLALSIVYPGDDPRIEGEFAFLQRYLPKDVSVFVGGRAATHYLTAIQRIGAAYYETLSDFRDALEKARSRPLPEQHAQSESSVNSRAG